MSFDNVLSFDSFGPKTDNNAYNDNARPATHVEYDQSRLLANQVGLGYNVCLSSL